ncbi:MAG: hypothetical protein LUJ25_04615 [Firmicutes bacterium]|nr:hypothetical protein [Bacillota bacterium]
MDEKERGQTGGELPQEAQEALRIASSPEYQKAVEIANARAQEDIAAAKTLEQLNIGDTIVSSIKEALQDRITGKDAQEAIAQTVKTYSETIQATAQKALEAAIGVSESIRPAIAAIAEQTNKILQLWAEQIEQANKEIDAFISTGTWSELKDLFPDAEQWLEMAQGLSAPFTADILAAFWDMMPEIRQYTAEHTEPGTLAALISEKEIEQAELNPDSPFQALIDTANKRLEAEEQQEQQETDSAAPAPATQAITVKSRLDKLDFPLDKVNSKMWNLLETDTGEQLRFAVEKAGSKKQLNVIYSIDFDEAEQAGLRISKKLDAFDKRVYIAAASLYAYRVDTMTIGQIYNAMGHDGAPGAKDREKINNSLSKMQMAHIFIDNKEEASEYKGYDHFRYDGYLLPLERVSRIVNGVAVDGVIHLLKEPPMYTFAKNRQQITTIQRTLLQTPLSKTNANLLLEDYLIERIARAKTGKGQKKILYKTVYDNTGVTTKLQRQRTRAKIAQLLEYYKSTDYIKGYTTSTDGVTIHL